MTIDSSFQSESEDTMIRRLRFNLPEYEKNPDAIANKYAIRGMSICVTLMLFVWILNTLQIFMVDQTTINTATTIALLIYLIGRTVLVVVDLRKAWVKYFIIFWAFCVVTVLTTFLTFHAYLICILPIIYCSMYSSKKIMWWAYGLTVLGIIITVYVGYHHGLCDANMALLSGKPLTLYLGENGEFLLTEVNDRTDWTLPLFFVVPRSLICFCLTMVCSKISTIIRSSFEYTQELEALAEIDEMTGVYNRNKYLSMTSEGYVKEDKLAVIFWDINYLKKVNDTLGHEQGDMLIKVVAATIRKISNQFDHAYRIGGDEFVMIMRGGDEISVLKKIEEWKDEIAKVANIDSIPVSAAYGYAYGKGTELEEIIHKADQMMYENKRKFHTDREV